MSATRYLLDRYADDVERWGIVDVRDGLPFWVAMIGCPIGVAVLMPLLHRRWSYLERPHLVVTLLISLHVIVLRYFGNPPSLPIRELRSMLQRIHRPVSEESVCATPQTGRM